MAFNRDRALELLRIGSGTPDAAFRDGQEEAIRYVVEGNGRLLVVQKTGWGKSFVYFIASKLLREAGAGPAILISPLLALMRNQLLAAERMGVSAVTINSENLDQWSQIESTLQRDEVDILLISPERLANPRFREHVLAHLAGRVSLLVVDEAHCISDWGHDFRPHYRSLERIIRSLPENLRVLATTATANNRVIEDLQAVLGPNLFRLRGDLNRSSLTLQTIRLHGQAERLAWLAENVPRLEGSGIIYTLTVRDTILVADWLRSQGLAVEAYSGQTGELRPELEQALLDNRIKALVATTALGMGFDKPDLSFVIHYQAPGLVVAYYQQVGRAGRAIPSAYGILLGGQEDTDITDYFIEQAFPTRDEVALILKALEAAPEGLTVPQMLGRVNAPQGRIDKALLLLSLESPAPIASQGSRWQLVAADLNESFWQRAERLTALRRQEQEQMQTYVDLPSGHMDFLIRALDGRPRGITTALLPPLPVEVCDAVAREAVAFLRRTSLPIEPRKKWPVGGLPHSQVSGLIPDTLRAEAGKALCLWGDAGWGGLVRKGKYKTGTFSEELIDACAALIRAWNPAPRPTWVTCIPSHRHPHLVPDFAQRLAKKLDLPFLAVLARTDDRPEQKKMANSAQQARNVDGSLSLMDIPFPAGPVLLIDDMVDSRWTFTLASWLLRQNGSGEVWPLALAKTGKD
ncbi:MAG: DEAD/DEAH box helicase [Rhodothermales bacterium]|nr:DEAD/DEAH box helicase [Rhodothermales bacterium]